MMKKFTFILMLTCLASMGWAQTLVFEQSFQDFTTAGEAPPTGWVSLNEDGLTVDPFYTDQGIFTDAGWEHVFFGNDLIGIWSCSSFTGAGAAEDWLISPQITMTANPSVSFEISSLAGDQIELWATTSIAGATPVASDFTGAALQTFTSTGTINSGTWETFSYDLTAFAGQDVYLAFVNVSNGGDIFGFRNMMVEQFEANDIAAVSASTAGAQLFETDYLQNNLPYGTYSCGGPAAAQVIIEVENTGLNPITTFDASFVIDSFDLGNPTATETVVLGSPLAPGATTTYTFTATADLSGGDPLYGVYVWAELTGDPVQTNDTAFLDFLFTPATWDMAVDGDFEEGFEQVDFGVGQFNINSSWSWTIIDANNDGNPMTISAANAGDPRSGDFTLQYFWNNDATTSANDFAFSPCIALEAGTGYQMSAWANAGDDGNGNVFAERFRFVVNSSPVATGVTTVGSLNDVTSTSYEEFTGSFTVPTTGEYYVGVNCNSDADKFFLNIDDLKLTSFTAAPTAGVSVVASSIDEMNGSVFVEYCDGEVTVTNTSTGVVDDVTIDWGDGSPIESFTTSNATHTYTSTGTYTVTVTASNVLGTSSATQTIEYTAIPAPQASVAIVSGPNAQGEITILNSSTPSCAEVIIEWGDGSTPGNGSSIGHDYQLDGDYTITVTVIVPGSQPNQQTINVTIATGIEDINFTEALNIYPNPASDIVNVAFGLGNAQDVAVSITSIDGKEIAVSNFENATDVNTNFNVSKLNAGIYFMTITTENGSTTQRFVVSHK